VKIFQTPKGGCLFNAEAFVDEEVLEAVFVGLKDIGRRGRGRRCCMYGTFLLCLLSPLNQCNLASCYFSPLV
jgi:hypothetical protein